MSKVYKLVQGERILAEVHNDIQTNGVFVSTPKFSETENVSIYELTDFESEQGIFEVTTCDINGN